MMVSVFGIVSKRENGNKGSSRFRIVQLSPCAAEQARFGQAVASGRLCLMDGWCRRRVDI